MKRSTAAGLIMFLAFGGTAAILLFTGPRMREQAHIRTYDAAMPATPEDSVPITDIRPPVPTTQEALALRNPLAATADNLARGRTYYGYYCLACHGERGDGNGPVGVSYTVKPVDLRSARVRDLPDGLLYQRMLLGTGHAPVLERVVHPDHRWYVVLYVRSLAP